MQSLTELQRIFNLLPEKPAFLESATIERAIRFTGIPAFKNTLSILSQIQGYESEVKILLSSQLYQTTAEGLVVQNSNGAYDISRAARFLQDSTIAMIRLMPSLLPAEQPECIYIRFPEAENIGLITKDLTSIEKATMQIVANNDIGGSFKVVRWESGSLWIHVLVGSASAVTIIAGAAWSAAVVAKKWMEVRIFFQHAEGLAIKNDSLEDLRNAQKKMLDELVASEAKALADKHFDSSNDPEIVERVRFAIATFSELIRRGGEVAPSLNAPEQVENLFPNYKNLPSIQSQIPQIEDMQ